MKTLVSSSSEQDALFLLEHGADPAASFAPFGNVLHLSCFKLYFQTTEKILSVWKGGLNQKCSKNQNSPLHSLAGSFDKDRNEAGRIFDLLLREGADLSLRNHFNHTFLSHSINMRIEGALDHVVQYAALKQQDGPRGFGPGRLSSESGQAAPIDAVLFGGQRLDPELPPAGREWRVSLRGVDRDIPQTHESGQLAALHT